jgi:GDP-mannose 6-dehydrogenase
MKVAVIGLGYVGTVTAACLAANGHEVAGVDTDTAKVAEIRAGRSPVAEPGLADLVRGAVAEGRLTATTSCREAMDGTVLSLVCVGTPALVDGATDLSHVRKAVGQIAAALEEARSAPSREHTVVIRSTVPPGTTEDVVLPALAASRAHQRLKVTAGMCPEFLREGSGIADFYGAPFVVAGTRDPHAAQAMASLFGFLPAPVHVVPPRVAESLKYACNAFHATKVSFANEVSRVLRPLGVDAREVMSLLCADGVLSISAAYLRPGFAFGGSCLPKDLRSLLQVARVHGADLPLLAGALASNERVIGDAVDRVLAWCPELYLSRFPDGPRLPYRALLALERWTHRCAEHVIATNDSYREIAIRRGGKHPGEVTVVRTGPDLERMRPGPARPALRRGHRFLVAYIGIMGPQDGVDIAVRAADIVVHELGRTDIAFTLIGSGDFFGELVALRDRLGLAGHVEFTGRAADGAVAEILSTADIGLCPDPPNPLNRVSTMNKTVEYMAFGLPVVAFDLPETQIFVADAGVYVGSGDVRDYAAAIVELVDDEPTRSLMGKLGRERVETELAWTHQRRAYLGVYGRLTGSGAAHSGTGR